MEAKNVTKIIIHQSASEFGDKTDIDLWHKQRGFKRIHNGVLYHIGYHFVILNGSIDKGEFDSELDGFIETGRPMDCSGAHTIGENERSIGICCIGNGLNPFTNAQLNSLESLLRGLLVQFPHLTKDDIYGHNAFANKLCPGINVAKFVADRLGDL